MLFNKNNTLCFWFGLIFILLSCQNNATDKTSKQDREEQGRDLNEIKEDSVLNIITTYSPTSYFLYRGEPMGYEYDMAKLLAKELELELNVVVAKNFNEVFELLAKGEGDVIAFGLTITNERKKKISFTEPLYSTHQVLVQRKPQNWRELSVDEIENILIRNPSELIEDTVYIGKGTSYYDRLKNLEEEIGGEIYTEELEGDLTTNDIITMVAEGEIDYTVADYNLAMVDKSFYPNLDAETNLSLAQRIGWGVRKTAPELLEAINRWIVSFQDNSLYTVLYNKYFKNTTEYKPRLSSDLFSLNTGNISPYDKLIQKYSEDLGWDWRLVTAQIYQESQFDAKSEGYLGSSGLLQLMPTTAEGLGVNNLFDPEENIRAGTAYLKEIYTGFNEIEDSVQRIKFSLAAFNTGPGHVHDAQRLAEELGDDPYIWDDNVENAMLKLQKNKYYNRPEIKHGLVHGTIPYNYVREIFDRYDHYRKLIILNPHADLDSNGAEYTVKTEEEQ